MIKYDYTRDISKQKNAIKVYMCFYGEIRKKVFANSIRPFRFDFQYC